jgi:hypothetical protein
MWYIISQIIVCLLVAALLGGVIGWLARGILSENRQTKSERRLRSVVNSREQ